jgi:cyanophycin synthetase
MVGDFLELCGFPTPKGKNCFTEEEILAEAEKLGWPVVIKPVAGHKGQGVTTGIESIPEAKKAFNNIVVAAQEAGVAFEGALVQQQIYGYDHRILTIGGKFVACLKREPAFVVGDGKSTIKELIDADNELEIRADTARSPLCKIKLDADMLDFMKLRGLTPEVVPAKDEKVVLRRVANISAGGVSFNVTNDMHPENIKMAENIAKFLNVTALGIDVLAGDISQSWRDGNFGIIEINAGPGVFMHLAPAFGGSVDIPGYLMEHFFTKDFRKSRVPIIVGNYITKTLAQAVYEELLALKPDVEFGCVKTDGIYFNNDFFTHCDHAENCKILFRNPKLDIALVDHDNENIHDYGTYHLGHDVAILDKANYAERILERDLMPDGILIEITEDGEEAESKGNTKIVVKKAGEIVTEKEIADPEQTEQLIVEALKPFLKEILEKYE